MGVPQILMIALLSFSLALSANKHGKDREGKENFWVTLISLAIHVSLLICGGFFK